MAPPAAEPAHGCTNDAIGTQSPRHEACSFPNFQLSGIPDATGQSTCSCVLLLQDIIFYGLPDHPTYYSELVANAFPHAVLEGMHSTVCTYFSKFEFLQLTQILGYARATKLLQRTSSTFVLC